jgi:hypothetical protein
MTDDEYWQSVYDRQIERLVSPVSASKYADLALHHRKRGPQAIEPAIHTVKILPPQVEPAGVDEVANPGGES